MGVVTGLVTTMVRVLLDDEHVDIGKLTNLVGDATQQHTFDLAKPSATYDYQS